MPAGGGEGEKQMYLEACLQQRRHFYPIVASVDGFLGVVATATLKRGIHLPGNKVAAILL